MGTAPAPKLADRARFVRPRLLARARAELLGMLDDALAVRLAAGLAIFTLTAASLRVLHQSTNVATLLWGLVMLASFAGWGCWTAVHVVGLRRLGAGLTLSLGMATVIALGGVLLAARVASGPVLRAVVLLGSVRFGLDLCTGTAIDLFRGPVATAATEEEATRSRYGTALYLALAAIGVLVLVQLLGAAWEGPHLRYISTDDKPAYLPLVQEIVDTGASLQPFSFRRVACLGAQLVLEAMVASGLTIDRIYMLDRGVGLALLVALVLDDLPRARGAWPLLVLAVFATLQLPRLNQNSSTEFTGAALVLALYRCMAGATDEARPLRRALTHALLAAGICALRQNLIIPTVVLFLVVHVQALVKELRRGGSKRAWKEAGAAAGVVALLTFVLVAPWCIASFEAVHTPWWPLAYGDFHAPELLSFGGTKSVRLHDAWSHLMSAGLFATPLLVLFSAATASDGSRNGAMRGLLAAYFVSFAVVAASGLCKFDDAFARYQFPFYCAMFLAAVAEAVRRGMDGRVGVLAVVAASVTVQVYASKERLREAMDGYVYDIETVAKGDYRPELTSHRDLYARLQHAVPPKAKLFAMTDEAYDFDFRRNHVLLADQPYTAGPGGGMPRGDGEHLAQYFASQGIRYVVYTDSAQTATFYGRKAWEDARTNESPAQGFWASGMLEMFDHLAYFKRTRRTVAAEGGLTLLDLATAAPPPPPQAPQPPPPPAQVNAE